MINALNRLLDVAFRVDSDTALNGGIAGSSSVGTVAVDVKRALTLLKTEAYDEASATFD